MVGEGNGGAGQHGGATPAQAMAVAGAVGRSAAADAHVSLDADQRERAGGAVDYQRVPDGQEEESVAAGGRDASVVGRADAVRGSGGAVEVDEEQPLLTDGGAGSDHDVRARVARGADVAGRQGVSVPGCCTIELGGEELLLDCTDGSHLHVWAARGGTKAAAGRLEPLCTLAKAGHRIGSFIKLHGRDRIVTGGGDGEVRAFSPFHR